MDDKALADRVLALGVGHIGYDRGRPTGYCVKPADHSMGVVDFLRDPRVAMALMERCESGVDFLRERPTGMWYAITVDGGCEGRSDSLPRAIVEACVTALEES